MSGETNMIYLLAAALAAAAAGLFGSLLYIQKMQKILRQIAPDGGRGGRIIPLRQLEELQRDLESVRGAARQLDDVTRDRELMETRMKFAQLQNQINPHFLYNTLENIRARAILDDNEVIADMTEALSRFFRYNISKRSDVVKLSEELDNIRTYMHIQQYRFSNKFDFQVFVHDEQNDVMNAQIPKMTLQPIVENAIFHGMEEKIGKGHIEIHIEFDERNVYLIVEDDGVGMSEEALFRLREKLAAKPDGSWETGHGSDGIAMRNVNNRLKLLYGSDYGITVSSEEGVGTEVSLTLPRHFAQNGPGAEGGTRAEGGMRAESGMRTEGGMRAAGGAP